MFGSNTAVFVALFASMALTACAATEKPGLQNSNAISVTRAQSPDYDFVVSIPAAQSSGYDPNDKETRDRTALSALKDQCEAPQVVGETVITSGTFLLGDQSRAYAVQVRC
ncbi:hypothetical protein [Hyphomicrobium sp. 99]|uniref:hypothetical protein n=1 Tax=Hyphomicrobium sp. 99 TaxID=1163419 RepID=UPI0005F856A6|nr:hypothetical protein [Hyphomicrobium sp. 99]